MSELELNNIIIISGPSGAGEDSVIEGLRAYTTVNRVITTTTRNMREGEAQGEPYYFIAHDEFEAKKANGEMAEWAQQYNGNLYGVTNDELERVNNLEGVGVWKIEYQGVINMKEKFPGLKAIMLMAESPEVLEQRIRDRSDVTDEFIAERMEYTKEWMKHKDVYDYVIVNEQGQLDAAIAEAVEILKKENLI